MSDIAFEFHPPLTLLNRWRDDPRGQSLAEVLITGFTVDLVFLERFCVPVARAGRFDQPRVVAGQRRYARIAEAAVRDRRVHCISRIRKIVSLDGDTAPIGLDERNQRPSKRGARFSRNDASPSAKSFERAVATRIAGISANAACSPCSR